jgi:hypothetical protein
MPAPRVSQATMQALATVYVCARVRAHVCAYAWVCVYVRMCVCLYHDCIGPQLWAGGAPTST